MKAKRKQHFISLLALLFVMLYQSGFSQVSAYELGAECGPSMASIRGNTTISTFHEPKLAYSFGVFGQYHFKKLISLKTGLYFEEKGSNAEVPVQNQFGIIENVTIKESFKYLSLPFLVKASFGRRLICFINAGPSIGFLLSAKQTIEAFNGQPEQTSDFTDFMNRTEMALSGGIGLSYPLFDQFVFSFELRDNLGLSNISSTLSSDNSKIQSNTLNALIGISYQFKK